ncbi:P-loop ATPase, Sll1717 family [Serpens gallinarum]|uniref:ATP-binding protein n=1 Tax=Serpens gallinarum TaxID=2763075 RepID=A0ABR8TSZ4_9PSED|nr:hypothetical protein [Serpens gallinarum]MBD7978888.1 hypothetical protein [Serpens gallinarum]
MLNVNLKDKKLFGNEAGEDENLEILNSYYIDNSDFDDFFDADESLSIVSARKGMGKSALLSRLQYKLINDTEYKNPIVIRVKGNDLLGLGDFSGDDHSYLENYWKQIICKKIIVEIGDSIGFALTSDEMSMVELSEIEGLKSKNFIGGLISRLIGKLPALNMEVKGFQPSNLTELLKNYQNNHKNSRVWILIDDIDAKYTNTPDQQARVGSFFSAIRALSFTLNGLNIRASVRSDVWSCLKHLEDLDKLEQYVIEIVWTRRHMRDMLANKILSYIKRKHPSAEEANYKLGRDYNKLIDLVFESPIQWGGDDNAKMFDAISAFSNKRPRWMGQLGRMSGKKAKERSPHAKRITLDDIRFILEEFGKNRRDDLIKEHQHQFDELSNLIDSLRATQKEFNSIDLHKIIDKNFIRGRDASVIPPVDGKVYVEPKDLGTFLYKLGLISRIHEDRKTFTHFTDDPDLYNSSENSKGNIVWSIHLSYREFLNIH